MIEPSLQLGGGNWANKSDSLLGYHKDGANFYADELTFSRNSLASYTDANGLIQTMPWNLASYSEQFDNAAWTKYSCTITANTTETTAPNGTNSADILVSASATASSGIEGNVAYINGAEYTVSIFAKYKNTPFIQMLAPSFVSTNFVNFNIQTGAVVGGTYAFTPTITSVGNGWYRCLFTYLSNYTGTTAISPIFLIDSASATRGQAFTGDGVKGAYIYGAQLNQGSTALPYFATTTRLNLARVDYKDNINGSLLLEPQRTNLALYSEQFDNAYWTKLGATITANATTSPDGTQNADKLVEDVGSVQPSFYRTSIANSNATYTKSIYAKAGERIWLVMNIGNGINSARAWFNLSTGVVGTVNAGLTAQIQDADNGWYRCTITREIVAFASSVIEFQIATSDGVEGYTGNGTSGLFIYGCQFEAGSYVSSYIKSEGAATTRLADSCSKTGISDKIGQTEGVIFLDFIASAQNADGVAFSAITIFGNATNNFQIYTIGTALYWYARDSSGVLLDESANQTLVAGQRYKMAYAYKSGDSALYINGVQKRTSTAAAVPAVSQFNLNATSYGASVATVKNDFSQVQLYKTRLTNAELATLTTL